MAKPLVFEICNTHFCYNQIIPDAKNWTYITDVNDRKYIRVFFYEKNRLLDIYVDGKTVTVKK
jgi:hypothetical protein